MKNRLLLLLFLPFLLFLMISCGSTTQNENEEGNYALVWGDSFDGPELDEGNWNVEVNGDGGGNHELQFYRKENVSIGREPVTGESCLILTAKKENYKGKEATSGRINSKEKRFFKYGKIEARIKLPRTENGLWPAFWMLGNDYSSVGWPACGEIDILEMGNSKGIQDDIQDRYFNGALHWGPNWKQVHHFAKVNTAPYDLQDDFHLFTLVWGKDSIKMFLDQDQYPKNRPYLAVALNDQDSIAEYFNKDAFLLFNLAVGGDFTGIHQIDQISALNSGEVKMYVDYVRVFEERNNANK